MQISVFRSSEYRVCLLNEADEESFWSFDGTAGSNDLVLRRFGHPFYYIFETGGNNERFITSYGYIRD